MDVNLEFAGCGPTADSKVKKPKNRRHGQPTTAKGKKAKQHDLATGRMDLKVSEESGPTRPATSTVKKINRKAKVRKVTNDEVSASMLAVTKKCMKKTYNGPERGITKLSPLGKGKLMVERLSRLKQLAYSTALAAATANGKGVVGLGRGSNGKQCLYFLAPIRFPKSGFTSQKSSSLSSSVISIASANSTETEQPLPEFTEILQSRNIPMVSGASEDYPATIFDYSSVATNSFDVCPSDTSESSFSDPNQADDTWISEFLNINTKYL